MNFNEYENEVQCKLDNIFKELEILNDCATNYYNAPKTSTNILLGEPRNKKFTLVMFNAYKRAIIDKLNALEDFMVLHGDNENE